MAGENTGAVAFPGFVFWLLCELSFLLGYSAVVVLGLLFQCQVVANKDHYRASVLTASDCVHVWWYEV